MSTAEDFVVDDLGDVWMSVVGITDPLSFGDRPFDLLRRQVVEATGIPRRPVGELGFEGCGTNPF